MWTVTQRGNLDLQFLRPSFARFNYHQQWLQLIFPPTTVFRVSVYIIFLIDDRQQSYYLFVASIANGDAVVLGHQATAL